MIQANGAYKIKRKSKPGLNLANRSITNQVAPNERIMKIVGGEDTRPPLPKTGKTTAADLGRAAAQQLVNGMMSRADLMRMTTNDPRRDLNKECGYPEILTIDHFVSMWEREPIAARVINHMPHECFALQPKLYENEKPKETSFEKRWEQLETEFNIWRYLEELDVKSGIGNFGVLLFGLPGDLESPAPGYDYRAAKRTPAKDTELLYMRVFHQGHVHITKWEDDIGNPRCGWPLEYEITFFDPKSFLLREGTQPQPKAQTRKVHWSRVLHLSEGGDVTSMPRMQQSYNRICDLQKTYGGAAEMFFRGGFPGFSFELDPNIVVEGIGIDAETKAKIREEFTEYSEGFSRFLATAGFAVKSLAPNIADPATHIRIHLEAISVCIETPIRIFMGSEEGALASSQDTRNWNKRISRRQYIHLQPNLVNRSTKQLQQYGVLPKIPKWMVSWPDLNTPTDDDRATVAQKRTIALSQYADKKVERYMSFVDYLHHVQGYTLEVAHALNDGREKILKKHGINPKKWLQEPDPVKKDNGIVRTDRTRKAQGSRKARSPSSSAGRGGR